MMNMEMYLEMWNMKKVKKVKVLRPGLLVSDSAIICLWL